MSASRARWKRTRATVELCQRRRRYRDGKRLTQRERCRYAITLSYPIRGDLYVTDVVSDKPLKQGSRVTVEYDSRDPRHNSLNYPRRERAAFRLALIFAALILLPLLAIALIGL